jgi:hypothetical protein
MVVENVGMAITVTTVAIAMTITSSRSLNPAEDTAELGRSLERPLMPEIAHILMIRLVFPCSCTQRQSKRNPWG